MLITKFSILVFVEEPQTELHTFLLRVFYLLLHFNCEWIIFNSLILKVCIVKVMFFFFFPSSHVYMWDLDHKEDWVPKNWCFWTVVLEKTLESPWDCKEIKPVNPKGNQFWIYVERINAEAETLILWPPDVKNRLIWKDLDAGKDWRQEEKERTEDETVGGNHRLNGHECEQTPGDDEGQGSLVYYSPWSCKESDMT